VDDANMAARLALRFLSLESDMLAFAPHVRPSQKQAGGGIVNHAETAHFAARLA